MKNEFSGGQEEMQVTMSAVRDALPVICEECGSQLFQEVLMLRKIPALLTGTGKPGLIPIPVFACVKCGSVNEEFLPAELRPKHIEEE